MEAASYPEMSLRPQHFGGVSSADQPRWNRIYIALAAVRFATPSLP